MTPLYTACLNDHVGVVQLLLQTSADINANKADEYGETPLYIACKKNHGGVVRLLLAREDIQVNQANNRGWTPLYVVCRTPLYGASQTDNVDIVQLLLSRKEILINQAPQDGETPLAAACFYGNDDVVRLRIEKHRCTTHVGTIGRVSCDSCWQDININKVTKMDGRHWTSSGIEVSRNSKNFLNKKVGFTKIITDKFDNITPFRCCCVFLNILCIFLISLFVAITSPIRKCI